MKFTEAELRAIARRVYDPDASAARTDGVTSLSADERAGLIDLIAKLDGDDPTTLVDRHDIYLAGMCLGAMRRRALRADRGGN